MQFPESLADLKAEDLKALRDEAIAERNRLAAISDDDITDEQIGEFEAVVSFVESVDAETTARETAAQERAERLAAIRAKATEAEESNTTEAESEDGGDEGEPEKPLDVVIPDDASEIIEEEQVTASGGAVERVRGKAPTVIIHDAPEEPEVRPGATLVAAANVPGYVPSQELPDLNEVAKAFSARSRNFGSAPNPDGMAALVAAGSVPLSGQEQRFGVAKIKKPASEFDIGGNMPIDQQYELVMAAAKESRLPGGSLVASANRPGLTAAASGGWCAPSEYLYDFCSFEEVSGLISIPEITVRRGGFHFTKGPDYGTLAAAIGFQQDEAAAQAQTVKSCYAIECPPFEEVRLDVVGFCITAGILTNHAYPELIRRVLEIAAVAHAHKVNKYVIDKIVAAAGAAVDLSGMKGSSTAETLEGLDLAAAVMRTELFMGHDRTLEVILPTWAKNVIRADLSRRTGVDMLAVSDAQIASYFAARNLAVQYVNDWQVLAKGATAWPTKMNAVIYPAGAFVKGGSEVIDIDTMYDPTNLSKNQYTAAFFEESILVANTCGGAKQITLDVCTSGQTGAADITC